MTLKLIKKLILIKLLVLIVIVLSLFISNYVKAYAFSDQSSLEEEVLIEASAHVSTLRDDIFSAFLFWK